MEASPRPAFELSKWYLDAVGEDGEVFIGYRANLRWRRLAISYASALTAGARDARTRSTARPGKEPDFFEGALAWAESKLAARATWRGAASPIVHTLYESPEGAVQWHCLLPSARAEVACDGVVLRGLGYAERLSMTIPPWRLPIDTLRWGRFLSPEHSVVWIDWERESARRTWVFANGAEVEGRVSEEGIFFEGGRVELPAPGRLVLRSGRLSYLLRSLPLSLPLRTRLGSRALAIHETKWRTRGRLELDGAPAVEGWAIHEVVRFRA
jgi:hypothetical protein